MVLSSIDTIAVILSDWCNTRVTLMLDRVKIRKKCLALHICIRASCKAKYYKMQRLKITSVKVCCAACLWRLHKTLPLSPCQVMVSRHRGLAQACKNVASLVEHLSNGTSALWRKNCESIHNFIFFLSHMLSEHVWQKSCSDKLPNISLSLQ